MALDRIDFEILSALQNDARLANKELAARIGMAPSSCLERVRTLTRAGVLRGSHADVDAAALGIGLEALVAIRLVKHSREAFRSLYATMLAMPEVLTVFHVSGVNDLLVHIAVRDIHHARDLIVERFATRAEVDHCETSVIFDMHRNHQLPCYQQPAGAKPSAAARKRRR